MVETKGVNVNKGWFCVLGTLAVLNSIIEAQPFMV
jgi:hypothetical protein